MMSSMQMSQIWPLLSSVTQVWLIEHNGEPLPSDIASELLSITGGSRDSRWWAGLRAGEMCLADEVVDWIEETANG